MANLTWGKPKLEIWKVVQGSTPTPVDWLLFPDAKQDSAKLSAGKGTKLEAIIEGGEPIDVLYRKNKFTFECEIWVQKGQSKPIEEDDGVTDGFYSLRLTPEDSSLEGWQLDKTKVSVETTWTSKDGTLLKYTFEALEPTSGNVLKPYTETYEVQRGLTAIDLNISFAVSGDMTNEKLYIKIDGSVYSNNIGDNSITIELPSTGEIVIAYPKTVTGIYFETVGQISGEVISDLSIAINLISQSVSLVSCENASSVSISGCEVVVVNAPKATTVNISGCDYLENIICPSVSLLTIGSTSIQQIQAPNATFVDVTGCSNLTSINVPKVTEFIFSGTKISKLNLPLVTGIDGDSNVYLESAYCPNAESVDLSNCTVLSELEGDKFTYLGLSGCAFTVLSIASLLRALVLKHTIASGKTLNLTGGNNAGYSTWTTQAKADKATLAGWGWTITNKA
ncbi:MAG: hypothetical protein WCK78_04200 [Paludibacter sp.]